MVGKVAAERRAIEPVFTEIKDRQNQIERALVDIETDDKKNNLADRLKDLDRDASALLARVNTVQDSFTTLNRFKDELVKSQAELVPLRAPEAGINALIAELRLSRDALDKTLQELESTGDDALSARVEALSRNKIEIEQRVAHVEDSFNILDAIRMDFEELKQRRARLERSLAEVETDAEGKSLVERQNAMNEFVIQSRLRHGAMQESFATLTRFKEELAKSQADLIPLQAPVFGIEALIGEAHAARDLLVRTIEEIESSGDTALGSRVEALSRSKREIEGRLAQIFENFTTLDAVRKDIGGLFTTIRNTLNRMG
jgi:DNA repair exonuclease SbcCD ATPase subunit